MLAGVALGMRGEQCMRARSESRRLRGTRERASYGGCRHRGQCVKASRRGIDPSTLKKSTQ
eukprot:59385-Pleurochrysis_carterae.AAC.3